MMRSFGVGFASGIITAAGFAFLVIQGFPGTAKVSEGYTVTYRVISVANQHYKSGTGASLTFTNAQGGSQQETIYIPWENSFRAAPGAHLYISAQNYDGWGNITAIILVDGREVRRSESSGRFAGTTASVRCC
jgi:hypothetical protein